MHFLPQLSDFVPLKKRFHSFRAQIGEHHPVDAGTSYTAVVPRGVADLYGHTTTRNTRDRSITHSLQRWVLTKYSISQLECFFFYFYNIYGLSYVQYIPLV